MASMTELITPKQQAEIRPAVQRIGAFASAARPEHLTTDIRRLFKRNILDSIACAIAAVASPSLRPLRDQI
jgi:2-methylcitrate dehydratase